MEFTRLIGESFPSAELCQQRFQSAIGATNASEPRYLLILDNLETFDSIVQIEHFLDQSVTLPSKVILTSRHDDFQGDYRLPVGGLTKEQASTLLVREARRLYCEPRMTAEVQERLFATTGGRAYALKLAAAQIAKATPVDEIVRAGLNREDILAALFDRSFELLSPDGAFLFLLLGFLRRRTSELAIMATFSGTKKDYAEAREALARVALLNHDADESGVTLALPEMAQQYAARRLRSHPDAIEVRHIGENVKEWATPVSGQSASEAFLDRLAQALDKAQHNSQATAELLDIMEAAGGQDPSLLPSIASHCVRIGIEFDRTEGAFRRAVEEASPNDAAIWRQWAEYARAREDMENEVLRRIRAVEIDSSSAQECSDVAYLLSLFLRDHKDDYPIARRAFLFRSVRNALERHRELGKLNGYRPQSVGVALPKRSPRGKSRSRLGHPRLRMCARWATSGAREPSLPKPSRSRWERAPGGRRASAKLAGSGCSLGYRLPLHLKGVLDRRLRGTRLVGSEMSVSPSGLASCRSNTVNVSISSGASGARFRRPTVTCWRMPASTSRSIACSSPGTTARSSLTPWWSSAVARRAMREQADQPSTRGAPARAARCSRGR